MAPRCRSLLPQGWIPGLTRFGRSVHAGREESCLSQLQTANCVPLNGDSGSFILHRYPHTVSLPTVVIKHGSSHPGKTKTVVGFGGREGGGKLRRRGLPVPCPEGPVAAPSRGVAYDRSSCW